MDEEFEGFAPTEDSFEDGYGRRWVFNLLEPAWRELASDLLRLAASEPSELAKAFDPWVLTRLLPGVVVSGGRNGRFDEDLTLALRGEAVARDASQALVFALLDLAGDNAAMRDGIQTAMSIAGLVGSCSPGEVAP